MENRKICAIVGEVPEELEFGYDEDYYLCAEMKYRLVSAMQEAISEGYTGFAATAEQGAAMWGAEACAAIKELGGRITFTAAPEYESQADRWHPERRERYFDILEKADEFIDPSEECHGTEYILANCDKVIILGDPALPRLAAVFDEAKSRGIKVRTA